MNNNEEVECCDLRTGKRCNKCDKLRPFGDFNDGRKTCKDCRKNYNAQAYQSNREKLIAYNSKRYHMKKDLKSVENIKI